MAYQKITPGVLVQHIRDNQKSNKDIKSFFGTQFFGKFDMEELEGFKHSIDKEIEKRSDDTIKEQIDYLKKHGYKVKKSK